MTRHRWFSLAFGGVLLALSSANAFECPEIQPQDYRETWYSVNRLSVTVPKGTATTFYDSLCGEFNLVFVQTIDYNFRPETSLAMFAVNRAVVSCDTTAAMLATAVLAKYSGRCLDASANTLDRVGGPQDVSQQEMPQPATLLTVRPNPFNPSATITYRVGTHGMTRVEVFAVTGQRIRELVNAAATPGTHSVVWDGKDGKGKAVSSGVYVVRFTSPGAVVSRRVTLAR